MLLYSLSLLAERIRKMLKIWVQVLLRTPQSPKVPKAKSNAICSDPILPDPFRVLMIELSSFHLGSMIRYSHFPFAHFNLLFSPLLASERPLSRPQLPFSLDIHFHHFNHQFYVVNFQISLPALNSHWTFTLPRLKLNSGSVVCVLQRDLDESQKTGQVWA